VQEHRDFLADVEVITHHAICMEGPVEPYAHLYDHYKEQCTITVFQINILLPVTA
jgi:hypothetical protein